MRKRRDSRHKIMRDLPSRGDLDTLARRAGYGGNPAHKRNPGDFGLTPPSDPRPLKTLCDEIGIMTRHAALELLREGIRRGFVSAAWDNAWPKRVWSVDAQDRVVEAVLENRETGTYHGYPMDSADPLAADILRRWRPHAG